MLHSTHISKTIKLAKICKSNFLKKILGHQWFAFLHNMLKCFFTFYSHIDDNSSNIGTDI